MGGVRAWARGLEQETPLLYAAYYGRTAVCEALVAAGASVHHRNRAGQTALHKVPRGPGGALEDGRAVHRGNALRSCTCCDGTVR
jgi:hypothetical protein